MALISATPVIHSTSPVFQSCMYWIRKGGHSVFSFGGITHDNGGGNIYPLKVIKSKYVIPPCCVADIVCKLKTPTDLAG